MKLARKKVSHGRRDLVSCTTTSESEATSSSFVGRSICFQPDQSAAIEYDWLCRRARGGRPEMPNTRTQCLPTAKTAGAEANVSGPRRCHDVSVSPFVVQVPPADLTLNQ